MISLSDLQVASHSNASILFDATDLKLYQRWQRVSNVPAARYNAVPTAFEYEDFLHWRQHSRRFPRSRAFRGFGTEKQEVVEEERGDEGKGKWKDEGWTLATKCKHPLHPSHPLLKSSSLSKPEESERETTIERCPVCTIRAYLTFQSVLFSAWAAVGGPWRIWDTSGDPGGAKYQACMKAFHAAKQCMANTVVDLQDWADWERIWEVDNPGVDVGLCEEWCARRAVEVFWEENCYSVENPEGEKEEAGFEEGGAVQPIARLSASPFRSNASKLAFTPKTPPQKRTSSPAKNLSWSPDTPSSTLNRPSASYSRVCAAYDPASKYACPEPDGWEDTSFLRDWTHNISQCRILLCHKSWTTVYRELNPFREDSDENTHVARLEGIIKEWLEEQSEADRAYWTQVLARTSDIFLVWKNEKGVWVDTEEFDAFEMVASLKGSAVEYYARLIEDRDGEIDERANADETLEERRELDLEAVPKLIGGSGSEIIEEDEDEDEDGGKWNRRMRILI